MARKFMIGLLVVIFALAGSSLLTGCAKKEVRTDMPAPGSGDKAGGDKQGLSEDELREQKLKEELARKRMMFLNEMVHFDFDKYDIRPDAAEVLKAKAAWLEENSAVAVIIEGHCDERGNRRLQPGPGREPGQRGQEVPGRPGHRRQSPGDHLLRRRAALGSGSQRSGLGQEPAGPVRYQVGLIK